MSFKPGDKVCCSYRLPTPHQWWSPSQVWVGTVEEPGTDKAAWNGHNSEAHYCDICRKVWVRYSWGVQHDSAASLFPSPQPEDFHVRSQEEAQALVDLAQHATA